MTRSTNLSDPGFFALASAGVLAACLSCQPSTGIGPVFPTSAELPTSPRRPDGVAVDPAAQLPPSSDIARPHDPIAVLRPPLPDKAVLAVIAAFFRSVVNDDVQGLADLITNDATITTRSKAAAPPLLDHWRARMRRISYRKLADQPVYDSAQVEIYRYDDLATARPGRPVRPSTMTRSDLLAQAPVTTSKLGHERLFGDDIVFLLRQENDGLRIREVTEDFQLP
jgi:hypothetical protein